MSAHAKFAPSSAYRWLSCPFSATAAAGLPNPESEESAEGTRVHALVEAALEGAATHCGEPDDIQYAVDLVVAYVRQLPDTDYYTEHKVVLSDHVWGTVDFFSPDPYVATLLDYKNGAMDVQVEGNSQLMTYAASVLEQHGPSKFYRLVIVQPNSRTSGEQDDVKQWIATLAQVEEHRERVLDAVRRGLAGEAPQPGRHCRYCPVFGNCPATRELLPFILTVITLHPMEVPTDIAVRVLRTIKGMEDWRKGLEKDLMRRIAAGQTVPEGHVGLNPVHRRWTDETAAKTELMGLFGLAGVDPVSPATADKMGPSGKALVSRLAYKPPGNPALKY